eukprot:15446404-Alexandrium_andersonii.AAC.1
MFAGLAAPAFLSACLRACLPASCFPACVWAQHDVPIGSGSPAQVRSARICPRSPIGLFAECLFDRP